MQIPKLVIAIIIISQSLLAAASSKIRNNASDGAKAYPAKCSETILDKNNLIVNWRLAEPYQFSNIDTNGKYVVTGLDIEVINALTTKITVGIKYNESIWDQAILAIQNGTSDMLAGVTYTDERAVFAEFSLPYRFEEISLFILRDSRKHLSFGNFNEFLAQVRLLNFRLGIISKVVYGDAKTTNYLNQVSNGDIIIKYRTRSELFNALIRNEIEGFLSDRIPAMSLILQSSHKAQIEEIPTGIKTPIHLMFSKKTVSPDLVERFNRAIKELISSSDYKRIIKNYMYHVLLPEAIDSMWCYIIGVIGSIAFAISGITIAAKKNATLFETFLIAMLPSLLGCILLDMTVEPSNNGFVLTPFYTYIILVTVLVGFATVKFLDYYNKKLYEDQFINEVWNNVVIVCEALGQASFIIIGVVTAIMHKIEPLEFWGPCFACLTSTIGIILRNLICNDNMMAQKNNNVLRGINFEISILWSLVFSILLDTHAYNPDYSTIKYSIITVIAGAFTSRVLIHYYNIPNLTFYADDVEVAVKDVKNKI